MKEGQWLLEAHVIMLCGLSGNHGGKNLGRYVAGLCDHMGIIRNETSKVSSHQVSM